MSLSDEYYKKDFDLVLNSGLIGKMSNFVHRLTESFVPNSRYGTILEVGSGSGKHKFFVKNNFDSYFETDLRIDNPGELTFLIDGENSLVTRLQSDAQNLTLFADKSVDRLIATCLLVHLPDPEIALREWRRVLATNGVATIFLPCEPGILLRAFRFFTTIPKSKKFGIDHRAIHYREHRNMYIFCDLLINEIFEKDSVRRIKFPIPFFSWNFRLFDLIIIQKKDHEK
jgi:phosphatidylethanolamine/phosphatidyl-N-methylethanolamine N-methyltransferase